ncbi:hypothetical protein [Actinokineospora inagensis]|uniref:hypothetical protein n=1 Tax=Actinokineospora inagensis TaxID=103730 RepID=UPI00040AA903|nr:hypothetical protein [Actinokineospora inagensis]
MCSTGGSTVPGELPCPPPRLHCRSDLIAVLNRAWAAASDGGHAAVLTGPPAVGQLAAVTRWAWDHRDRFPGGQVYVDLAADRVRHEAGIPAIQRRVLTALGVPGPVRDADLTPVLRAATAAAPVLVVLVGVERPAEIDKFLPTAPHSMLLGTSVRRLGRHRRWTHPVAPLGRAAATAFLRRQLPGGVRHTLDPAIGALVDRCLGLPDRLLDLAALLADCGSTAEAFERVGDGSPLDWSAGVDPLTGYDDAIDTVLDDAQRHVYYCLGLHPAEAVCVPSLAKAAGTKDSAVRATLHLLRELCYVQHAGVRYRPYPVVKAHAGELAHRRLTRHALDRVNDRYLSWYLSGTAAASRALDLDWPGAADFAVQPWCGPDLSAAAAKSWLESERPALDRVIAEAAGRGRGGVVSAFCLGMWSFYPHLDFDWIGLHVNALRYDGLTRGVRMRVLRQLARVHADQGRTADRDATLAEAARVRDARPRGLPANAPVIRPGEP